MKSIKLIWVFLGTAVFTLIILFASQNGKSTGEIMPLSTMFGYTFIVSLIVTFGASLIIKK